MLSTLKKIILMKNEEGATAIEYALIVSLLAVAAMAAMSSVSGKETTVSDNTAMTSR